MSLRQKPVYYCDICDTECEPEKLRRVRSERRAEAPGNFKSVGIDVCGPCESRPISDLIAAIDRASGVAAS